MDYKRIAIIGISASGKSTASRILASKTRLPLFHMDQLFWRESGEDVPEEEYLEKHAVLTAYEEWIIEGYVDEKMSERLKRADLVLYLDYSRWRCSIQLMRRWLTRPQARRFELVPEALEKFSARFLWRVFSRGERPRIEKAIQVAHPIVMHRFSTPGEFKKFLLEKF